MHEINIQIAIHLDAGPPVFWRRHLMFQVIGLETSRSIVGLGYFAYGARGVL